MNCAVQKVVSKSCDAHSAGSTGAPKGVMITHRNVFKCLNSWLYQLNGIQIRASDRWIGYLPLAHILELLAEMMMLVFGIPIGYSSPNTLTDKVQRNIFNNSNIFL